MTRLARQELQALNAKFQDERDAMEDKRKESEDQLAALKIRLTEVRPDTNPDTLKAHMRANAYMNACPLQACC